MIHCRGIDAPITLSFHEIINDPVLLSNFSSIHAAWIGYYYGKYYKELIKEKGNYSVPFSLSSNPAHEKNCILMLTRQGNLVYLNHATNVAHTAHPTRIMANMNLIIRFEPMQACYIGILSGLYKEKKVISRSSVQLTLVK